METRSITFIHEGNRNSPVILALYRHLDGYFEGMGEDLKTFLKGFNIVNGIGANMPDKTANGMGCLAAQIVAHFKTEIGNFYIARPDNPDDEEFGYHVFLEKGKIRVDGRGHDESKKIL